MFRAPALPDVVLTLSTKGGRRPLSLSLENMEVETIARRRAKLSAISLAIYLPVLLPLKNQVQQKPEIIYTKSIYHAKGPALEEGAMAVVVVVVVGLSQPW